MQHWIPSLILEDDTVCLAPLEERHRDGLLAAAADGELWSLWYTSVPSEATMEAYIAQALEQRQQGLACPFVVLDAKRGTIIGSTRYCHLQPEHRRLEIGYTWYAQSYQRTRVNTACKRLLLGYAFEERQCIAVQFMTNWHNLRSRAAIARLGAHQDGVLRHHRLQADGSYRDSVVFSITDIDWPNVKKTLDHRLGLLG